MNRDFRHFRDKYQDAGARDIFETATRELIAAMFPNDSVETILASQGDDGIDIVKGNIGIEPISVYQCKFFLDKIDNSQRTQIKKSLKTAIESKNYTLKEWILVVPKFNLTLSEQKWWDKLKVTTKNDVNLDIDLITGEKFISLSKKHKVYNKIFEIDEALKIDEILNILKENSIKIKSDKEHDLEIFNEHLQCFNREAFWFSCLTEISIYELNSAIKDTTKALTTGVLIDREERTKIKDFDAVTNYKTDEFINLSKTIVSKLAELKRLILNLQGLSKRIDTDYEKHPMFVGIISKLNQIKDENLIREFIIGANSIDNKRNEIIELLMQYSDIPRLIELSSELIIKNDPRLVFVVSQKVIEIAKKI